MKSAHKRPVSALVVVYDSDLRVLLLQRADHPEYWQSVTGSCENEEMPAQAAARELQEETGLMLSQGTLSDWQQTNRYLIYPHWRHRYAPGVTHNQEHVFGFELQQPATICLSAREHSSYEWVPWQQAATRVFSPSNREAIEQLPQKRTISL